MIDFELSPELRAAREFYRRYGAEQMRPLSREYDENEHARPWDFLHDAWEMSRSGRVPAAPPKERNLFTTVVVEEMSWGDAGLYYLRPGSGLGSAAIIAAGTKEQKERLLGRRDGKPRWAAMAITEPGCGSDTSAIQTTAVRDGDHWVLNGTKVFCTNGALALDESEGLTVVWATVDKSAGRAGIKPFVVEAGTAGVTVAKLEDKMGFRVSDTAQLIFEDCRVPANNLLGESDVNQPKQGGGFKGAMATFDATRPIVAATSVGIARAALELLQATLVSEGFEVRYGVSPNRLSALERDVIELEAEIEATRLLTWRAAWMMDRGQKNSLEASIAKAKAGQMVNRVTQRVVEHLGPLGYSRRLLAEKWMRDAKINDIFEGTQQINLLIIARRILGYGSAELD
jgi:acyl-CoA dehydrogenase